ncbi:MAG: DUF4954 family protein [Prevotella sp.]|nr:DUF4954 family protein [Candidatus Equicola faecalis]
MRQLKKEEITVLERQGCRAENWERIMVAEEFAATSVHNVRFYGDVEIGRNCRLTDVKIIRGSGKQNGAVKISVLNEGGDGNVVLCPNLTAQLAWMMIHFPSVCRLAEKENDDGGRCIIGDGAVIEGATKISDCIIQSSEEIPTYIGPDVIMEKSVTACGAEVTDGAKVYESFVGEAVHLGKGFSSEASCFFANSYMDNGEACAALCGPFSCSHHKSTLLIGGEFSFYNAGSNTNQSNHAYKMGPIHWGTLQRGAKTASGCHILWPATIGAFSMVMGKVTQHPDLGKLPFSYIFGDTVKTYVYPGTNLKTVGTWRDINKWPTRDRRPATRPTDGSDIITYDFPNPYLLQVAREGKQVLETLRKEQGDVEEYTYQNCAIKRTALEKGIRYYDLILALGHAEVTMCDDKRYIDMLGFIVDEESVNTLAAKVEDGKISTLKDLQRGIATLRTLRTPLSTGSEAYKQWVEMIKKDARKEFNMGDVSEEQLTDFIKNMKWTTAVHLLHQQGH